MLFWFNHPAYERARRRLIKALLSPTYRFRRSDPIIFLCGKFESSARKALRSFLELKSTTRARVFYAESVWEILSTSAPNALSMEAKLAELADMVIIIAESPGTFAELGAFSLSEALRKKILPVVDSEFEHVTKSFLATGPLRWINEESQFKPAIFVPLDSILAAGSEFEDRLKKIPKAAPKSARLTSSSIQVMLFMCDLISITHPITCEMISRYLEVLLPGRPKDLEVNTLLALGVATGLLRYKDLSGDRFYAPEGFEVLSNPFHDIHKPMFGSVEAMRAEHAQVTLRIPEAAKIMSEME